MAVGIDRIVYMTGKGSGSGDGMLWEDDSYATQKKR